jgi:hypothetical protein
VGYCDDDDAAAAVVVVVVVVVGLSVRPLFGKTIDYGADDVRYGSDSGKSYLVDPDHVHCYCSVAILRKKTMSDVDAPAVVALVDD